MDVELGQLIEKIRQEGVEQGEEQSKEILEKATKEAILTKQKAKEEAENIINLAKQEAQRFKDNAQMTINQAVRDLMLVLKEKIINLFDSVLKQEITEALTPELLKEIILKVVENYSSSDQIEISLNQQDKDQLFSLVLNSLKQKLGESFTIGINNKINKGFRLTKQGENINYDFTDDSIFAVFKEFLNPSLKEVLNKYNG